MKLALQHTDNNRYPRCGIFIRHASPKVWLKEITRMQLKLSECRVYPCPGLEANSISGVLIIFEKDQKKIEIQHHISVQKVHTGFYIPENTTLNMALTQEEYAKLFQGKPHFFHHEYGLLELKEEVRWEALIHAPREQFPAIETPAKGVQIPMKVTAFSVEIEEKETEKALNNPLGDEKINTKDLPFDMKKVLEGNNKEIEKYLKYLEKNPEAALKMAVPLDMLGTSRGKAFAKYRFKSNFFESIGFANTSEQTKTGIRAFLGILAIIAIFWLGYVVLDAYKKNQIEVVRNGYVETSEGTTDVQGTEEELVIDSEGTNSNISSGKIRSDEESGGTYPDGESSETAIYKAGEIIVLFLVFFIGFIFIGYLIVNRKKKRLKTSNVEKNASSWMNLPEESELFSFNDEPKRRRGYQFYFGGDELSVQGQVLLVFILIAAIGYLLYPMFTDGGVKTIFIIITVGLVIRLLYFLFNKNKPLKDE